jgi:hypothetical protein
MITGLSRELFKFLCGQIVESDSLIHASIIPLSVLVVETFCSSQLMKGGKSNK